MAKKAVRVRRVYDDARDDDGARVLVDRVWPRGVKKESARLDDWAKDVAPSTDLRKWYGHDPDKFAEFRRSYRRELESPDAEEAFENLRERARSGTLTLLTATKDVEHSQARVLADLLAGGLVTAPDTGGDPVCWLHRVCPECGRLADEDPPTRCPNCDAEIPGE